MAWFAIVSGWGSAITSMLKTYSNWLGSRVVLQIETGESLVPLRGLIVDESDHALRFRLDGGWEVDIYKEMILRVEADNYEAFQLRNWEANNKAAGAARSDWMPMLRWNRAFDRWWSKHFSWQLWWKTIIYAGLTGSVLFVLALGASAPGPLAQFARFLCGYLGLAFLAVSAGCGVWAIIDSIKTQSDILAKWWKVIASFLEWFRQPIHL